MIEEIENRVMGNIMVVDDTPANLKLLTQILEERCFEVRPIPRGDLAIKAAENDPPDLVLLDINMPGMNGYEVCAIFKSKEDLRDIPIIFISALSETMDKVRAFSIGGIDYITKPFQRKEVLARVETHLKIHKLQRELEKQNKHLEDSYAELNKLEHMKENLVHMIVHDLRSPLSAICGYLELLQCDAASFTEEQNTYINYSLMSSNTLITMISDVLDVTRIEDGKMPVKKKDSNLVDIAEEAIKSVWSLVSGQLKKEYEQETAITAYCDPDIIRRVIVNLLVNAVKFTPKDKKVILAIEKTVDSLHISVKDQGEGIPTEYHDKIFEKFGQAESRKQKIKYSTGLGLTFCKLAIEAHGGEIGLDSDIGKGSTFWISLPKSLVGENV